MYIIKHEGLLVNIGEEASDFNSKPLRFGDKVLLISPKREIRYSYFLGKSVSGSSTSILDPDYYGRIKHAENHCIIKYDWIADEPSLITTLKKISDLLMKEHGVDLYA